MANYINYKIQFKKINRYILYQLSVIAEKLNTCNPQRRFNTYNLREKLAELEKRCNEAARCPMPKPPEEEPPTKIVVAGAFSCGKSTFLNSLIGQDIMPVGDQPITRAITVIKYKPHDDIDKSRYSTYIFKRFKKLKIKYFCGKKPLTDNEYCRLVQKEIDKSEIRDREFCIEVNNERLRSLELYDAPGFNPHYASEKNKILDRTLSEHALSLADEVFFLIDMRDGTLKTDQGDYIENFYKEKADNNKVLPHLHVIITQSDRKPSSKHAAIKKQIEKSFENRLSKYKIKPSFFFYSKNEENKQLLAELDRMRQTNINKVHTNYEAEKLALVAHINEKINDNISEAKKLVNEWLSMAEKYAQDRTYVNLFKLDEQLLLKRLRECAADCYNSIKYAQPKGEKILGIIFDDVKLKLPDYDELAILPNIGQVVTLLGNNLINNEDVRKIIEANLKKQYEELIRRYKETHTEAELQLGAFTEDGLKANQISLQNHYTNYLVERQEWFLTAVANACFYEIKSTVNPINIQKQADFQRSAIRSKTTKIISKVRELLSNEKY